MRILFASTPADGHFHPLTGIAAHLAAVGHDVRWYAGPEYGRKLDALGMIHFPYRRATEVMAGNLNVLYPERSALRGPRLIAFDAEKFFVTNVDRYLDDIQELRSEFPFDVFFCDGGMYVAKLVAEVLRVPVYVTAISPVVPGGPVSPPPFFGLRPARSVVGRIVHGVVRRMLRSGMRPGVLAYNEILAGHGLPPVELDGFPHQPMLSATRLFLSGSPALEFPGYRPPPNAEFVGALRPAPRTFAGDVPPVVADSSATVVALAQGTVDNTDPGKLVVPALEGLRDGPYTVVVTTAGGRTEELRRRFGGPGVVIEDFIDYDTLFPHVDVFVTNGGHGSVLSAMRHGVPVVTAGRTEGKNDVNARVRHNRLGVDLGGEHPNPAAVRAGVERVLSDPVIRANVAAARAELDSYDPLARIEEVLGNQRALR